MPARKYVTFHPLHATDRAAYRTTLTHDCPRAGDYDTDITIGHRFTILPRKPSRIRRIVRHLYGYDAFSLYALAFLIIVLLLRP